MFKGTLGFGRLRNCRIFWSWAVDAAEPIWTARSPSARTPSTRYLSNLTNALTGWGQGLFRDTSFQGVKGKHGGVSSAMLATLLTAIFARRAR